MSGATRELGSLAKHRAYLGLPPKKVVSLEFPYRARRVYRAQVNGLARRLKAIGCRDVVLGLSGGLDSSLALVICVGAFKLLKLDFSGIHAYTMPGFGTSKATKNNAITLAEALGVAVETIPIAKSVRQHLKDIGHDGKTTDVTYENAQARMRTMILMDKANMVGGIVIGTGDMSEIALGWSTYNGDHMSMFNVNSGIPKTVVRRVCDWWSSIIGLRPGDNNRKIAWAMDDIVETPISPELVKGQVTEDIIGPYELHDFFLWNFIVNEMGTKDLLKVAKRKFSRHYSTKVIKRTLDIFMHRFFTQAFKRNCQPDGIKVYPFELSPHGWWIPSDLGQDVISKFRVGR